MSNPAKFLDTVIVRGVDGQSVVDHCGKVLDWRFWYGPGFLLMGLAVDGEFSCHLGVMRLKPSGLTCMFGCGSLKE
jgi:hypothetical protein